MNRFCLVWALVTGLSISAGAKVLGPYQVDSATSYLWHLDERAGATSSANDVPEQKALLAVDGAHVEAVESPTAGILGASGAPGFGCAAMIANASYGLAYDSNGNSVFDGDYKPEMSAEDSVQMRQLTGSHGEFTLEALVNLSTITGTAQEIISVENSKANPERVFQFVISLEGNLRFRDFGNDLKLESAIPKSGPHGFRRDAWFHVAYVYDGKGEGTLYWTALNDTSTEANLIGTFSAKNLQEGGSGTLVIGNENRNTFNEGLSGCIDEVRISNVARTKHQFLFGSEPQSNGRK